jgi:hypothetical protein
MAIPPAQNDSVITFGLDIAEETERSGGEIATGLGKEVEQMAGPETEQATPEQDQQAELQEAQQLAQAAREQEAADKAQELEPELERDGPER